MIMKRINKKILSLVLVVTLVLTVFGGHTINKVEAATNPSYMAKLVRNGGRIMHPLTCKADTLYTLTFNYYVETSATEPNMQARFQGSVIANDVQNVGVGEYEGKNTGYENRNSVKEMVVKYKTPETVSTSDWLGFFLEVTSEVEAKYYVWNIKVCENKSIENIARNSDFTEHATVSEGGTWIGWQMTKYPADGGGYTYIDTVEKSNTAAEKSGNVIVTYDRDTYEFLPDYSSLPDYEWNAQQKTLSFTKDCEFNLSDITDYHLYQDGKIFIGWKDQSGTWLTKTQASTKQTFAKNTVLTAQYMDFNQGETTDFAIISEEMRTDGTLGLRYIVELSKNLKDRLPNAGEYGTIVLPSVVLDHNEIPWTMTVLNTKDSGTWYNNTYSGTWADLTYDGTYQYNGKTYKTQVVKADKLYDETDSALKYTLCITNINEKKDNYDRQYTVKGYMKYVDNNGIDRILYTDYASTNPYIASNSALENTELDDDAKQTLQSIVNTVYAGYLRARNSITTEAISTSNTPTYKDGSQGTNEKLYYLSNKTRMREVTFDFGLGEGNELEVMHMSDFHYNYMNQYDFAEAYHTLLATYDVRANTWAANVQGKGNLATGTKLLEYARTADQLVITGDIMDYLSAGAGELLHREFWDKYPNTMITLGNHEISQKVSETVKETLDTTTRYNRLTKLWEHDHTYSKKMLGDKVMLIQIDNSANVFFESQYALLQNDIKEAREKGYQILMFMHEPLVTGDQDDTAVSSLWVSDGKETYDFYNNKANSNVYPDRDEATKNVYELITASADVIKGIFNGHIHNNFYTEIKATGNNGETYIPQYTAGAAFTGDFTKIIIK